VACGVARKLVEAVREADIANEHGVRVTVSAGVASSPPTALDATALFEAADRAVFEAKRLGRDREHWASPLAFTSEPR
jgi:PleD family two-component response regulator